MRRTLIGTKTNDHIPKQKREEPKEDEATDERNEVVEASVRGIRRKGMVAFQMRGKSRFPALGGLMSGIAGAVAGGAQQNMQGPFMALEPAPAPAMSPYMGAMSPMAAPQGMPYGGNPLMGAAPSYPYPGRARGNHVDKQMTWFITVATIVMTYWTAGLICS